MISQTIATLSEKMETEPTKSSREILNPIFYKKFTIVIPAYNEEKRITPLITKITDFISKNNLPWKVIVSVDGNDGTADIVKKFSEKYNFVELNKSSGRNGKGAAIKRTLNQIDGEYVILMDADESVDFSTVIENIPLIEENDVVILSRYNEHSEVHFLRRFLSRGFNLLVKALIRINVDDTQSGYKIFRTSKFIEAIRKVGPSNTFYDVPLLYYIKQNGGKILETKVQYKHDKEGSKFHLISETVAFSISIIGFLLRHSHFYRFIPKSLENLYYRKFRWI